MGIRQTEQTKIAIVQTEGATQIFSRPLWAVALDPPVRDPSRSGQYLSWVTDFILGHCPLKDRNPNQNQNMELWELTLVVGYVEQKITKSKTKSVFLAQIFCESK